MIESASSRQLSELPPDTRAAGVEAAAPGAPLRYVGAKRCLDLVLTLALLIAAAPLMAVIGAMIAIDSGRPVFYRQERVGARARRHGRRVHWEERRFSIIKFRTMVRDADSRPVHQRYIESFVKGELPASGAGATVSKLDRDARVTRVGRLLRATSLDELPQLFNVLRGNMSLVGPRPVPPYEVALYEPHHRERLAALPGITGAWQVHGRGRVGFEEMVRMDVDYVRRHSLTRDLYLLAATVPAVISKRGAR